MLWFSPASCSHMLAGSASCVPGIAAISTEYTAPHDPHRTGVSWQPASAIAHCAPASTSAFRLSVIVFTYAILHHITHYVKPCRTQAAQLSPSSPQPTVRRSPTHQRTRSPLASRLLSRLLSLGGHCPQVTGKQLSCFCSLAAGKPAGNAHRFSFRLQFAGAASKGVV